MTRRNVYFIFSFAGLLLASACTKELLPEEFLKNVATDAALNKMQDDGQFRFSCSYRPGSFLALAELHKSRGNDIPGEAYTDEIRKFENALYFDLTMGLKNGKYIVTENLSAQAEYAHRLSELTYNLSRDFYMVEGTNRDTIRAITYNYSNNYGTGPDARFLFVFPRDVLSKGNKTIELVYEDKVFGINDPVRFEFSTSDITEKLPDIKFRKS